MISNLNKKPIKRLLILVLRNNENYVSEGKFWCIKGILLKELEIIQRKQKKKLQMEPENCLKRSGRLGSKKELEILSNPDAV